MWYRPQLTRQAGTKVGCALVVFVSVWVACHLYSMVVFLLTLFSSVSRLELAGQIHSVSRTGRVLEAGVHPASQDPQLSRGVNPIH
jgi:hypothetical protein